MKKIYLFLILSLLTVSGYGQFSAFYPDGKKITIKFNTIRELLDTLGIQEADSYSHKYGHVYFKRLSNKPIFILFLEKDYPEKIKEIISSYNLKYNRYLYSYPYYYDLKDMIKNHTLTQEYLLDIFKEPDIRAKNDEDKEYWIYNNYNVKITFDWNIANLADVINYNAFKRNQLAISSFNVTGSDYAIGFNISLTNFSSKTIKYVFITVTATNPVDDKVGTKIVKAVGPIKQTDIGSYEFDDIIYSRSAKYLSIDLIKIQYMDGAIKTIPKSEIQNIRLMDWEEVGNRTEDN